MISISDYYNQIFDMIIRTTDDWNHISKQIIYEFLSKPSTAYKLFNMSKKCIKITKRNHEKNV